MSYSKEKIEQLRHRWTTTKGKQLLKTIKNSKAYLSPVIFKQKVNHFQGINDEELGENSIDLRGAPLSGFDFRTTIEDDNGYSEKISILSNIHFDGAELKHCMFQDSKIFDCHFDQADLSHAELKTATINSCTFKETDCTGLNLYGTILTNCNFNDATIKDITLESTIIDERTTFGKMLKSEKEKNYHFAAIEYKKIKEMYKSSSLHSIADNFHYKEMIAKRKLSPKKHPLRTLNYIFGDLLCKYGTSFVRVLIWCFVLIIICALFFNIGENLVYNGNKISPTIFDSIYFSIVSFTTLGYGDYHAIGATRFIAAGESFIGAALMSLFTVIVARQIIRD